MGHLFAILSLLIGQKKDFFPLVISILIFSVFHVISSLTLRGLLCAFILVYDQSWGQQRIRDNWLCLSSS